MNGEEGTVFMYAGVQYTHMNMYENLSTATMITLILMPRSLFLPHNVSK